MSISMNKRIFAVILFVLTAIAYSISCAFFCGCCNNSVGDSVFWISSFLYSGNISVFCPFSQFVCKVLSLLFGDYFVVYRVFNVLTLVIASFIVLALVPSRQYLLGCTLVLGFFLFLLPVNHNCYVYNGVSLTVVFTSVFLYTLSKRHYFLLPFCILFILLSRFPNIVIVLFVALLAPLISKNKTEFLRILLGVFVGIALWLVMQIIIHNGIYSFYYSLSQELTVASSENGGEHTLSVMLETFNHSFKDIATQLKYLLLLAALISSSILISKKGLKFGVIALFLVISVLLFCFRSGILDRNLYQINIFSYAILYVVIIANFILAVLNRNKQYVGWILLTMAISLVPMAGTNTGLVGYALSLYPLAPLWFFVLFYQFKESDANTITMLIVELVVLGLSFALLIRKELFSVGVFLFLLSLVVLFIPSIKVNWRIKGTRMRYAPLIVYVPLLLFVSVVTFVNHLYLEQYCYKTIIPRYQHIRVSQKERGLLDNVWENLQAGDVKNTIFFGPSAILFYYALGKGFDSGSGFLFIMNEQNLQYLKEAVLTGDRLFLVNGYDTDYSMEIETIKSLFKDYQCSCCESDDYCLVIPI